MEIIGRDVGKVRMSFDHVIGQSALLIATLKASTVFVKTLMERPAGFANIKIIAVLTGYLIDDKALVAVVVLR